MRVVDFADLFTSSAQPTAGTVSGTSVTSAAFISSSSSPASAGLFRLANADAIKWRNNANSADIALGKDTSDQLSWAGVSFLSNAGILLAAAAPAFTGGDVTSSAGSLALSIGAGRVTNTMLAGSIAASKLIGSDIATVGTLTAGATGAGFTIALSTSTVTGTLADARLPASMATKTFTGTTSFPGSTSIDSSGNLSIGGGLSFTISSAFSITQTTPSSVTTAGKMLVLSSVPSGSTTLNSASTSTGDAGNFGSIGGINGWLFICDESSGPGAYYALTGSGPTITAVVADTQYSTTASTNSKVSVYVSGGNLIIENRTGSNKQFKVTLFKMG